MRREILVISIRETELYEWITGYGPDGGHLGFAFVDFVKVEDARAARENAHEKPIILINRALNVEYANRPSKRVQPSNKLYFEDFAGDTNDLREVLKKYSRFIEKIYFSERYMSVM